MPIEMLPERWKIINQFLLCMQATADYTSRGFGPWCAGKYERDVWYDCNKLSWDAFRALPVQDQQEWAEALFATCLGVAELGHVTERRSNQKITAFSGDTLIIPNAKIAAARVLAAKHRNHPGRREFGRMAFEKDWDTSKLPAKTSGEICEGMVWYDNSVWCRVHLRASVRDQEDWFYAWIAN